MRGTQQQQTEMFSYIPVGQRIPTDHLLRPIRQIMDQALGRLAKRLDRIYADGGRPSIPPEYLLRALLLQILYTIRSERMLMEQLDYNLLFRWFVGLNPDDPIWDVTVFTKNRDRLLQGNIAEALFDQVLVEARARDLLSSEHFTVDGTLVEAWASAKSFQPKQPPSRPEPPEDPGNPTVDFRGQQRSNQTHQSQTDPEAMLAKRAPGQRARLSYCGHVLMENRNGLVVNTRLTRATGTAEREAALEMVEQIPGQRRVTLGADKAYDAQDFIEQLRAGKITPHVAGYSHAHKRSTIDGRTTRSEGYRISQRKRKRVEEIFGWMKTIGLVRKLRHRGLAKVGWLFTLTATAYNLIRIGNLSWSSA